MCLAVRMGVEVPHKFWKGGQDPSMSSSEGQARTLRGMCTVLAFHFTQCSAPNPRALEGSTKGSGSQSWTLGGAPGGSRYEEEHSMPRLTSEIAEDWAVLAAPPPQTGGQGKT